MTPNQLFPEVCCTPGKDEPTGSGIIPLLCSPLGASGLHASVDLATMRITYERAARPKSLRGGGQPRTPRLSFVLTGGRAVWERRPDVGVGEGEAARPLTASSPPDCRPVVRAGLAQTQRQSRPWPGLSEARPVRKPGRTERSTKPLARKGRPSSVEHSAEEPFSSECFSLREEQSPQRQSWKAESKAEVKLAHLKLARGALRTNCIRTLQPCRTPAQGCTSAAQLGLGFPFSRGSLHLPGLRPQLHSPGSESLSGSCWGAPATPPHDTGVAPLDVSEEVRGVSTFQTG
ncbi:uncharacterized protein ACOB8E_018242 [Sarcophilus harrisii]